MSSKKKTPITPSTSPQMLKIGSRVRCTDDGIEGRIVWANAVAVKIQWDDREQVTWRRDSLAGRPIAILAAAGDEEEHAATADSEQPVAQPPLEYITTASASAEQPAEPPPAVATEMPEAVARTQTPPTDTPAEEAPPAEPSPEAPTPPEQTAEQLEIPSVVAKQPRTRKPKQAADNGKEKELSALDAAAKVLGETGQPMSCQEMIEAMATKGYWISPGGKTPAATLYSAIAREITTKGADSRFQKRDRGKFGRNGAA
jgi:outer membrane biosynthesis protein TonB